MGDFFLKLPHDSVEGMIKTDQHTLGSEVAQLSRHSRSLQQQLKPAGGT
jgi:chaperonin cofactor prefoldin|eukprot:COSAG01_NODE_5647_length_4118_cov_6.676288_5_plen_49_part_00